MKNPILKSLSVLFCLCITFTFSDVLLSQDWNEIIIGAASDSADGDHYGHSVSISGDYAIVGAEAEDHDSLGGSYKLNSGSAYIFYKNKGGTDKWGQIKKIEASDRDSEDRFGYSVSISGNYAIVGAYKEDEDTLGNNTFSEAGSAYIFYKNKGGTNNWGQVKKIVADDREADDWFGRSVSISGDYAIVGAFQEDEDETGTGSLTSSGSAYVFHKNQGGTNNWGQVKKIVANDREEGDWFGWSVSISGDYAIVGAYQEDHDATGNNSMTSSGSAYIYYKDQEGTNNWGQIKKIVANDRDDSDAFGYSVSISGNYAIVGAIAEEEDASGSINMRYAGSAYIFFKDLGETDNWGQVKKIVAGDRGVDDRFGKSVFISGNYAIVGAVEEDEDASGVPGSNFKSNAGSAYIFCKDQGGNDNWEQTQKIVASDRESNDRFGESVSISGSYANVGSEWNNNKGRNYIFMNIIQARNIDFSSTKSTTSVVKWKNGSFENRVVFIKSGNTGTASPVDNTTYSPNSAYGLGSQIGSTGWYCIYNGSDTTVSVTGLSPNTEYRVMVCEYNGGAGSEKYYTIDTTNNPANFTTGMDLSGTSINVATGQIFGTSSEMEYSLNSSNGIDGNFYNCAAGITNVVFVECDVYVREKTMISNYWLVANIPAPAVAPSYTINISEETTTEPIPATVEYNTDNTFSTPNTDGSGMVVPVNPGTDLYLRIKATESALPSEIQTLNVPDRPTTPSFTIDYISESTVESIPSTIEFNTDGNFATANSGGTGDVLAVTPGTDLYFRVKSSDTNFVSSIQTLVIPDRPATTSYSIDYISEATAENVVAADEYSNNPDMSGAIIGNYEEVSLTPGIDLFFRTKATISSFSGLKQTLNVPERPSMPIVSLSDKNSAAAGFKKSSDGTGTEVTTADGYEYSLNEGTNWSDCLDNTTIDATGPISIIVRKKATASSFRSPATGNLDHEVPVVTIISTDGCNGPDNSIHVQSNIDTGTVYLILDGEPQLTKSDFNAAIADSKGSKHIFKGADVNLAVPTSGIVAGTYYAYLVNILDSISEKSSVSVIIHDIPVVDLGIDITKCEPTEVTLDPGKDYNVYSWSYNNASTRSIKVTDEDDYILTVTDANGCTNSDTISVIYNIPFADEEICVVTVDLFTGKNVIVWESTADKGIQSINIYREDVLIGNVPYNDLSIFKDTIADPESRPFLYSISIIDSCGNESDQSPYHKPLFLQYVSSVDGVNLRWSKYEMENGDLTFDNYEIWRGGDSINLAPLVENIPVAVDVFTDNDESALMRKYYYRVAGILTDACSPTGDKKADTGPYQHTLSNMDDNKLKTGQYAPDTIIIDTNSIDEGNLVGAIIGKLVTEDKDTADLHSYQFVSGSGDDDNSSFSISEDQLLADVSFDFETKSQYTVRIRSTDIAGEYCEVIFIILINDIDEATGLPVLNEGAIRVYPNPFSHSTTITFANHSGEPYKLVLTDLSGKVCRILDGITTSEYILKKGDLKSGLYFIELRGPNTYRGKIVIE